MFVDFYGSSLEHDDSVFIPTTITKFAALKIPVDGKKVLDLGCGIGPLAIYYAKNGADSVTAADVANGFIQIPVVDGNGSLAVAPGNYFAALELYSGGSTYDIGIIDDRSVDQPYWSSAIWYPGAQAYTNGTAFAIRLNLGNVTSGVGINENTSDVSIYPNPSNGIVNIKFDNNSNNNVIIRDISGKKIQVLNTNSDIEIDFNNFGKGIYLVDILSNNKTITRKVTIQ